MHVAVPPPSKVGALLDGVRHRVTGSVDVVLSAALLRLVDMALDRIDLTALVRERVRLDEIVLDLDLDAIVARLDVDAIVARVDMESVIARLDLIELANGVVVGIDLPGIIRSSSASMASEAVSGVRIRSLEADEAISRAVTRWLPRRNREHDGLVAGVNGAAPADDRPEQPGR
jgi:hypothetical protein